MFETDIDILCPADSAVTIDNPSIDEEIKALTSDAQHYQEKLMSTLHARATLLRNAERLELALNDATVMMLLAPSSPLGYLFAGSIDSLRGHYDEAIYTYDYGLEKTPYSDPQRHLLLDARAEAYDRQHKRIDFISKLPLDIVTHNIIPKLLPREITIEIGEPSGFFDVCRTWRQRMALAIAWHFELGPLDLSADAYERVRDLAPFMRNLTVAQPKREILSKITKQNPGRFNMLKKLTIFESNGRGSSSLLSSLRTLGSTLTDLEIEYGHHRPKNRYRLCDVLDACPHLVSLHMMDGDVDMSSVTKTYPKLTTLVLHCTSYMLHDVNMSSVLHPFPQLRVLKLFPISGSNIFPVVDQHCPLLQQLILSGYHPDLGEVLESPERRGLRALSVNTDPGFSRFKEDDMVEYLIKHCETIEDLDIRQRFGFDDANNLLHQASSEQVTLKQLRRISYPADAEEGLISFLLWIIQHAPHLESVGTIYGPLQARIIQELIRPQHANLKRFCMHTSRSISEDAEELIEHHLGLGNESNMTEMTIEIGQEFDGSWLSMVPHLAQLTTIELYSRSYNGFKDLDLFIRVLADGCPALEQLTMTSHQCQVEFSDLYPMHRHPNLKRIIINCIRIHGDASTFCQRFKHIESFHLTAYSFDAEIIYTLDRASFTFILTPKRSRYAFLAHTKVKRRGVHVLQGPPRNQ